MTVGILDVVEVLHTRTLLSAASTEVSALAFCEPLDWSELEYVASEPCELPEPEIAVAEESVVSVNEASAFCEPLDWSEMEYVASEPCESPEPEIAVAEESVASMNEASAFCEPLDWSELEDVASEPCELPEPEIAVAEESVASVNEASAEFFEVPPVDAHFPEIIACALEPGLEIPVSTLGLESQGFDKSELWIPESTEDVNAAAENPESMEILPEVWFQEASFRGGDPEQLTVLLTTMRSNDAETGDPSDANLTYCEFSDACSTREPPALQDESEHGESAWVDPSVGIPVFPEDFVLVKSGILISSPEVDETAVSDDVEKPDQLPLSPRQRGVFVVLPADVSDNVVLASEEFVATAGELESLIPVRPVAMRSSTLVSESGAVPRHFRIPVPRFSPTLLPVLQPTPFSLRDPGMADTRQFARVTDTVAHRESPAWTAASGSVGEFIRPVPSRKWHRTDKDVSSKQTLPLNLLKSSRRTPPAELRPERETESESEKQFEEAVPADVTQASSDDTNAAEAHTPVENTAESAVADTVAQNP